MAAKLGGRGIVCEVQADSRLVIIAAMQEGNSQTGATAGLADGQGAYAAVAQKIKDWGQELGFAAIGIARADVSAAAPWLLRWLALGRHGEMDYMAKHAALRAAPSLLLPGALSVISARLAYWPAAVDAQRVLDDAEPGLRLALRTRA
jgi:epoxyqueuosine reductase